MERYKALVFPQKTETAKQEPNQESVTLSVQAPCLVDNWVADSAVQPVEIQRNTPPAEPVEIPVQEYSRNAPALKWNTASVVS